LQRSPKVYAGAKDVDARNCNRAVEGILLDLDSVADIYDAIEVEQVAVSATGDGLSRETSPRQCVRRTYEAHNRRSDIYVFAVGAPSGEPVASNRYHSSFGGAPRWIGAQRPQATSIAPFVTSDAFASILRAWSFSTVNQDDPLVVASRGLSFLDFSSSRLAHRWPQASSVAAALSRLNKCNVSENDVQSLWLSARKGPGAENSVRAEVRP